jgi:hypothetical protein
MPPTKTWKSRERKIAAYFGTQRTPLSGGNSGHTRSDTLHPTLFIEAKHRKRHAVISLWEETKKLAEKESKTPVIALTQHGKHGFWIMMHSDDLLDVARAIEFDLGRESGIIGGPTSPEGTTIDDQGVVPGESELA